MNSLNSTNCFVELFFFAFDCDVVNRTDGILSAMNSTTALTSSSFLNEHFC